MMQDYHRSPWYQDSPDRIRPPSSAPGNAIRIEPGLQVGHRRNQRISRYAIPSDAHAFRDRFSPWHLGHTAIPWAPVPEAPT